MYAVLVEVDYTGFSMQNCIKAIKISLIIWFWGKMLTQTMKKVTVTLDQFLPVEVLQ